MTDDEFEWDDARAETNYRKHGVAFETATEAFADHFGVEEVNPDSGIHGEEREAQAHIRPQSDKPGT
jgi:uncharacterized DUF497 family protein